MFVTIGQLFTEPRTALERLHEEGDLRKSLVSLLASLVVGGIVESLFLYFFAFMMDMIRMPIHTYSVAYLSPALFIKFGFVIFVEAVILAIIIAYVYYFITKFLQADCEKARFLATDFWAMTAVNWVLVIGLSLLLFFALIGFTIYEGFLFIGAWLSLMIGILFLCIAFFYYYLVAKVSTDLSDASIVTAMILTLAIFIVLGLGVNWSLTTIAMAV